MLRMLFVALIVMWVLGMVTSYTMGGLVHLLLLIAVIAIASDVINGRRRIV